MNTLSGRRRACSSSRVLTSTNALDPCVLIAADTAPPTATPSSGREDRPGKPDCSARWAREVREAVGERVGVGRGQRAGRPRHAAGRAVARAELLLAPPLQQ